MFVLILVALLIFMEYKKSVHREPGEPLTFLLGIADEDFETSILILFIITTVLYFAIIAFITQKSQRYFTGQNALISTFLHDYDIIYYIKMYENKYDDEIDGYHLSDEFSDFFNLKDIGSRFSDILKYMDDKLVYPEDRERFVAETKREVILPPLERDGTYFTNFRSDINGELRLYQIKFIYDSDKGKNRKGMVCSIRCIENEVKAEKRFYDSFTEKVEEKTKEVKEQNLRLNSLNESIIELLGSVIEEDRGHIKNVKGYVRMLATQFAEDYSEYLLTPAKIDMISSACALHDLGKIKIPYEVLYKNGKFTEEESELVKSHTVEGKNIIETYNPGWSEAYQRTCSDICIAHHERYDGKGYPYGLVGDNIPISAQIVSIADCFDVLISKRTYREEFTIDEAFR